MSLNERRKTKSLFSYIHPCLLLVSCGAAVSMQVPMSIVMTVVMPNLSCMFFIQKMYYFI